MPSINLNLYEFTIAGNKYYVAANTFEEGKKKFDEFSDDEGIKKEYLESVFRKGDLIY